MPLPAQRCDPAGRPEGSPPEAAAPDRLSLDTRVSLREISELLGECGHAVIWAVNAQRRGGALPSASEIIAGLRADLGLIVSASSAERALRLIRARAA